jgi:DNA mismatch repair protein MutS2
VLFPDHLERKIGFDQIRVLLSNYCTNEASRERLEAIRWSSSYAGVNRSLDEVSEYQKILSDGNGPSLLVADIRELFKSLELKNNYLEIDEVLEIRDFIRTSAKLYAFFHHAAERFPNLKSCVGDASINEDLIQEINKLFSDDGEWKVDASKTLRDLYDSDREKKYSVRQHINKIYKQCSELGIAADTDISVKDGRLVVPILSEHKRKLEGVVQDVSGNGRIFYIEPIQVLELSNELREIGLKMNLEKRKLLKKVCNQIRPELSDLKKAFHLIQIFDVIRAKAKLALDMDACKPELLKVPNILLREASHPLLLLNHRQKKMPVIPLDIEIDEEQRIILISGPNAGGKSVSLKTVALLQYMLQCGLLIPCHHQSKIGLFKDLMVDIGDDQSIENDLSSYSSHLQAMRYILEKANMASLICIDEIGVGTDPQFGAALALAIIEALNQKKIKGVITTHYGILKNLAEKTPGIVNARMKFDGEALIPLFSMELGKPGSSYAFEVAERMGLSKNILHEARKRVDVRQEKVDRLLAKLETEKSEIELMKSNLQKETRLMEQFKQDYKSLKVELDSKKKQMIEDARKKSLMILEKSNAEVERTIKAIRESAQAKPDIKKIRKGLETQKVQLQTELNKKLKVTPSKESNDIPPLKVGDRVHIKGSDGVGEIVEMRKDKAVVIAGIIKTTVSLSDLSHAHSKKQEKSQLRSQVKIMMHEREKDFELQKDVRGMRGQEALELIDDWIDNALMLGFYQLRIIHGKGDGILKQLIRNHLRNRTYVKSIRYEHIELVGEGVSLIELQ